MTLIHLGRAFALPHDSPFTYAAALAAGVGRRDLRQLLEAGVLRRLLRGVYAAAALPDTQLLRARAIRLVVPDGFVVTDESAGWLAGAPMILRPGSHLEVPPLKVFASGPHDRLRNELADSGTRRLLPRDVMDVHGVRVTTPLRTFLDLGRLLHRDRAIGALDQLLALDAFDHEEVYPEIVRFRGMRGVVQLRQLAPLADRRSESPPEATLRLRFHQGGLPTPVPQVDIFDEHGHFLGRGDLVVPHLMFLAEYDGDEFHDAAHAAHDEERRAAMRAAGWTIRVIRKEHLFGQHQEVIAMLWSGVHEAERRQSPRRLG